MLPEQSDPVLRSSLPAFSTLLFCSIIYISIRFQQSVYPACTLSVYMPLI